MIKNKESDWQRLQVKVKERFGEELDVQALLFLIGVQELGKLHQKFKKDDKVNVMHIAICTLLEPYGFYEFEGRDADGWPHWKLKENLPPLAGAQQNRLIIDAMIDYFKITEFLD